MEDDSQTKPHFEIETISAEQGGIQTNAIGGNATTSIDQAQHFTLNFLSTLPLNYLSTSHPRREGKYCNN
jgi:hypothetical protein